MVSHFSDLSLYPIKIHFFLTLLLNPRECSLCYLSVQKLLYVASKAAFTQTRFHSQPHRFRWDYAFTRHQLRPLAKPGRFENAAKSGAFSKRYRLICRINGETASISVRLTFCCEICIFRSQKVNLARSAALADAINYDFDFYFLVVLYSRNAS